MTDRPGGPHAHPRLLANPVEIDFSIIQRKVIAPNDFADLNQLERRLLDFERHSEAVARPFKRKFRHDLQNVLQRLPATELRHTEAA